MNASDVQTRAAQARKALQALSAPPAPVVAIVDAAIAVRCALDPEWGRQRDRDLEIAYGIRDPLTGRTTSKPPAGATGGYRDTRQCRGCRRLVSHKWAACRSCGHDPNVSGEHY